MDVYILFWNPATSGYTMEKFKENFKNHTQIGNWAFNDHDKVEFGNKFYLIKIGEGKTGIVGQGYITGKAYESKDWLNKSENLQYYADIWTNVTFDPDQVDDLITLEQLSEAMPDFNWYGGPSGQLLDQKNTVILNKLFIDWLDANPRLFPERAHLDVGQINLTMFDEVNEHLTEKYGKKCAICGYDYEKCFGEETAKENHLSVPFDLIVSKDLPHLIYRICNNCQRAGNDLLAQTLARKK